MSQTSQPQITRAADIAYHTAMYERAWRDRDDHAMREHYQTLDTLCTGNPHASVIRACCTIAATLTRPTSPDSRLSSQHLHDLCTRQQVIHEYVNDLQQITRQELQLTA